MHYFKTIILGLLLVSAAFGDDLVRPPADASVEDQIKFYLPLLKDKTYFDQDAHGSPFYVAAEQLALIGAPAIPFLMGRLDSTDRYEKNLVLYALRLGTQAQNVKKLTGGEWIETTGSFPYENLEVNEQIAKRWWAKYQSHWKTKNSRIQKESLPDERGGTAEPPAGK